MVLEIMFVFFISSWDFKPIANTVFVENGLQCGSPLVGRDPATCSAASALALPALIIDKHADGFLTLNAQFDVQLNSIPDEIYAIYLPKIADAVQIFVNGHQVMNMGSTDVAPIRHWGSPVFALIPAVLLGKTNTVDIAVTGYPQDGASLYPFYIGPARALASAYKWRLWFTKDMAFVGLIFVVISSAMFSFLAWVKPDDYKFRWLAIAALISSIFASHYTFTKFPLSYHWWTVLWNFALHVYIIAFYKFLIGYLQIKKQRIEHYIGPWLIVVAGVSLLMPANYIKIFFVGLHVVGLIIALLILTNLIYYGSRINRRRSLVLFLFMSAMLTVVFRDFIFQFYRPSPFNTQIGHLSFGAMMGLAIYMVISELLDSLKKYEHLNDSLEYQVEKTTARLKLSYEELVLAEREQVLNAERKRIMLDLHDGVGGQLVNTLAYMKNQEVTDTVVTTSLETSLFDLALVIDSMESADNLTAPLGMLRERLEPLLNSSNIQFEWNVREEPEIAAASPSNILNILRIAQEAITNAVKHSEASVIKVTTLKRSIIICDNGTGIKDKKRSKRNGLNTGLGMESMKNRARDAGIKLTIATSDTGTSVTMTSSIHADYQASR